MELAWRAVGAIARVAIWCGAAMLFIAAGIVTAEVLLRKGLGALFGTSFVFSGSDEISSYLFAVGTSWALAYVLMHRGHVRIDALYGTLGPKTRAVLDLIALLALAVFVAAMLERAWNVSFTSYIEETRSNTPLRVPLAWPQIPWFLGIALFALALVLAILRSLMAIVRGDFTAVGKIAGAVSQDEEIEGELEGLGLQRQGGVGVRREP